MSTYRSVLKEYWGYDEFRPLQGDIISSVGSGKDTLGLMPTGGGKSLTFQVPTMAMEGLCIVVTPLIALMKDQVENLQARGIKAVAIYSGMEQNDIIRTLDNCIFGDFKFLYVSPERLGTETFLQRLPSIPVCMIAVDESHCISQWGYDFRPSYLKIADIRKIIPNVPVLALTATATPDVVVDIQEKLGFAKPNVFQKSFSRSNLAYIVRYTENKMEYLLRILKAVPGTSVVYVRNRKRTKEVAEFLVEKGITAEHFHAGLSNEEKDARQQRWKSDITRVIVATNAFGMGIDKPEVRTVVHIDLPDTLEAYFQEAGRAGRDGKKAYATLLYNNTDATKMKKRVADSFPEKEFVLQVYENLGNFFQIGVGSGLDHTFAFDIANFCSVFKLPVLTTYSALSLLQQAGYIEFTDEQDSSPRVLFTINKDELYNMHNTTLQEKILHLLLRSYTGLFTQPAYINEEILSKRLNISTKQLNEELINLSKAHIIQYIPRNKTPYLTFVQERQLKNDVKLGKNVYENRKERYVTRVNAVLEYAQETDFCRSQVLLSYFGENDAKPCGQCDVCLKKQENDLKNGEYEAVRAKILQILNKQPLLLKDLLVKIGGNENKVVETIRFMQDHNEIGLDKQLRYHIISNSSNI